MVIDSSAVIAYLLEEPEAERVLAALARSPRSVLPTICHVECSIVLIRKLGDTGPALLDQLIRRHGLEVVSFNPDHALLASDAFLRFGKGRHPAGLNFGDCMSYAVARAERLPLLFVGEDFARTDVDRA